MPKKLQGWLNIEKDFYEKWNFARRLGAIDGKHIILQSPKNGGSQFYNYKGSFSVVLMAVVDANYRFIFTDIGCQGRISDGGVFETAPFTKSLTQISSIYRPKNHYRHK